MLCHDLAFGVGALVDDVIAAVAVCHYGTNGYEAAFVGSTMTDDDVLAGAMLAILCERCDDRIEIEVDDGPGADSGLMRALRAVPSASWGPTVLIVSDQAGVISVTHHHPGTA